jgi:hypothetical protein
MGKTRRNGFEARARAKKTDVLDAVVRARVMSFIPLVLHLSHATRQTFWSRM